MAFPKTHQRLMGPRIVIEHGHFHNARFQFQGCIAYLCLNLFEHGEQSVGRDYVRIVSNLIRRIGRTNFRHAPHIATLQLARDRSPFEESIERHVLADLDEDELVAAKCITGAHAASSLWLPLATRCTIHASRKFVWYRPARMSASASMA